MARYKAIVQYDGSNYSGWQVQPGKVTIQSTIQNALKTIHKQEVDVSSSGRTDGGVHAFGQVFHFDSELNIEEDKWVKAINAYLPQDIRIVQVSKVKEDFHSRYDAKWKHYDYKINLGEYNLFEYKHCYQLNEKLDLDEMIKASKHLLGTNDYTSFCGNSLEEMEDQVRTIYDIKFSLKDDELTISYYGSGFLRYMIRMITGTLIEVGKHRLEQEKVKELLNQRNKTCVTYNVPGCGLYLIEVGYQKYSQ